MFKALVRIVIVVLIMLGLFWFLDTNWDGFKQDVELQSPLDVFNINLPKIENGNTDLPDVTIEIGDKEESSTKEEQTDNKTEKENNKETNTATSTSSVESSLTVEDESTSEDINNHTGITKDDLDKLVSNIKISSNKNEEKYNRDSFENPSRKYDYNGTKLSRNKYAWHVSQHLISENPFEYTCPYTGLTITDFTSLDFDHIIPLNYVWKYGEIQNWSEKQMNNYANDIYIGVDVLNKSNRSKSDKGPNEWLPDTNIAQYCYSWLVIAEKYDIAMRQVDLNICKLECLNDLDHCYMINKVTLDIEDITQF